MDSTHLMPWLICRDISSYELDRKPIMDLKLRGKTALVTGSTAGIGLEIARKLAQEGADVIVCGRNQAKLDQALADIRASGGTNVRGIVADPVTVEGTDMLLKAQPSVDILVNNQGIYESK